MSKEEKEPQRWIIAEEDDFIHVIPDWDIRPHANVLNPIMGKFEVAGLECDCKPEIRLDENNRNTTKPVVVHNSFFDCEKINKSLAELLKSK